MTNYWDDLMGTDAGAGNYMETYGEGPGCDTRLLIGAMIEEGESVLDVGCGPGWNLDHFIEYGPSVKYKGTDYSGRFVRVANKRAKEKYPGLFKKSPPFEVGDVRKIGEPASSWDVVILQDCLEHTNGFIQPIMEALRVARKRVIITFWKGSFMDDNDSVDQINDDGNDGYGATYNRNNFENFLDSLDEIWMTTETPPDANRWHRMYVINKEDLE